MLLHLLENMESGKFSPVENYWRAEEYDLSKVTVPVVIYDKERPNSFVQSLVRIDVFWKNTFKIMFC